MNLGIIAGPDMSAMMAIEDTSAGQIMVVILFHCYYYARPGNRK